MFRIVGKPMLYHTYDDSAAMADGEEVMLKVCFTIEKDNHMTTSKQVQTPTPIKIDKLLVRDIDIPPGVVGTPYGVEHGVVGYSTIPNNEKDNAMTTAKQVQKPVPGLLVEDTTVSGGVDAKTGAPVIKPKTPSGKCDESMEPTDKREK